MSFIAALLAGTIIICQSFLSDYGECKITINGKKELIVKGGESLLSVLTSEKIFIPSACGGKATCGMCKLKVIEGGGNVLPTEEAFLTAQEKKEGFRLSCQLKVKSNLKIEIPEELFNVREYKSICEKITDLTPDIKLFRLKLSEAESVDYVPGQYVQLFSPKYSDKVEEVYRAYSIASDPKDKSVVELIIRLVPGGICTTYCFNYLKENNPVRFNGPYGKFRLSSTDADMVFIAGGSGMAPIRSMLYEMKNKGIKRKAEFFFGANTEKDLFLTEEMKDFEKQLFNFKYIPVVAKPQENWTGEKGLVTDAVDRYYSNLSNAEAYLCGSPGMIDNSIKVLLKHKMKEENIFYDKFA